MAATRNLLKALLEYPEIKQEIENIFLIANLTDYQLKTRSFKIQTFNEETFLLTFHSSDLELHLDIKFIDSKLIEICICEGDSKTKCNSIACGSTSKVLEAFKELL